MLRVLTVAVIAAALLAVAPPAFADQGQASWYGPGFQGRTMANGHVYDMYDPTTTASNIFPFGTWLKVTSVATGRSVVVQVRDRGAFRWALDLSYAAFLRIDNPAKMIIPIFYERVSGPGAQASAPAPTATPAATATPAPSKPTPTPTPQRATESSRSSRQGDVGADQYQVQPGDTLSGIAQSQNVSASSLIDLNGLPDADSIVAGQVLRLRPSATPVAAAGTSHVVAPGESLWSIAQQYGTDPDELAQANGISDPSLVVIGQVLTVPGGSPSSSGPRAASVHEVQVGETLWDIALAYGVSVDALASANSIDEADPLQIGQKLTIPAGGSQSAAGTRTATRHTVQAGETLSGIADQYGVTVEALAALNGIDDPGSIQVGQVVRLP